MKRALPIRRSIDALTKTNEFALEGRPLTARQVAELCGVELKTVHNWVLEGRIEHFRTPGRHLRFPRAAVSAFLSTCGYEAATQRRPKLAAVVVSAGRSGVVRNALRGFSLTVVADVPSALVVVARDEPSLLLFELTPGRPPPDTFTLQALARLVPKVQVVLFGKLARGRATQLHGAQVIDDKESLRDLAQALTSR